MTARDFELRHRGRSQTAPTVIRAIRGSYFSVFAIAALLCAITATSAAQTASLSGQITDPQGAGVASARITVYSQGALSSLRTESDSQGFYRAFLASGGPAVVEIEADGFRKTSKIVVLTEQQNVREDFPLQIAGVSSSVVVTASAAAQTIDQVAKAISVIDSRELSNRGEYTLSGALRTAPGVQVRNSGGPGQASQVRVRGLRPDATAILIDGMRFRDAAATQGDATPFLSNLNLIAVDRVEVLRGSGSSLYGTNAAGGVVNVVTEEGSSATHSTLQTEYGNLGFLRGRAQAGGALANRFGYSVGLLHLNVMRGVDGNDRTRSTGGQSFLRYDFTPATTASARLLGSDDFLQLNISPNTAGIPANNIPPTGIIPAVPLAPEQVQRLLHGEAVSYGRATYIPGRDDPDSRRASRHHAIALKFQHLLASRASFQVSYQRVHTNRVLSNGPAGAGFQPPVTNDSKFAGNIDTVDARANLHRSPWSTLTTGYEFERENYFDLQDNNLSGTQRIRTQTSIQENAHSIYFQDQLTLFRSRLQISVSGRDQFFRLIRPIFEAIGITNNYDRIPLTPPSKALTGDISMSYFISSTGTKLRSHVGNAYRAPSLYERFGGGFFSNPVNGQLVFTPFGDPYLKPDRYNSVDGGFDQYLCRDRIRISATQFYTRVVTVTAFDSGSIIRPATDPYGRTSGYINGSGGLSRGLELTAESHPTSSTTIAGSYTYTRANTDKDITVPSVWRVLGVSRHTVTAVATQQIGKRMVVTFDLSSNSGMFGSFTTAGRPRAFRYPGFTKTDVSTSYSIRRGDRSTAKINARIENVFNKAYYDLGWLAPGPVFVTGLSLTF